MGLAVGKEGMRVLCSARLHLVAPVGFKVPTTGRGKEQEGVPH